MGFGLSCTSMGFGFGCAVRRACFMLFAFSRLSGLDFARSIEFFCSGFRMIAGLGWGGGMWWLVEGIGKDWYSLSLGAAPPDPGTIRFALPTIMTLLVGFVWQHVKSSTRGLASGVLKEGNALAFLSPGDALAFGGVSHSPDLRGAVTKSQGRCGSLTWHQGSMRIAFWCCFWLCEGLDFQHIGPVCSWCCDCTAPANRNAAGVVIGGTFAWCCKGVGCWCCDCTAHPYRNAAGVLLGSTFVLLWKAVSQNVDLPWVPLDACLDDGFDCPKSFALKMFDDIVSGGVGCLWPAAGGVAVLREGMVVSSLIAETSSSSIFRPKHEKTCKRTKKKFSLRLEHGMHNESNWYYFPPKACMKLSFFFLIRFCSSPMCLMLLPTTRSLQ